MKGLSTVSTTAECLSNQDLNSLSFSEENVASTAEKQKPHAVLPSEMAMGVILPGGKRVKASDIHLELTTELAQLLAGTKAKDQHDKLTNLLGDIKTSPVVPQESSDHVIQSCWAIPFNQFMGRLLELNQKYDRLYSLAEGMHQTIRILREKRD